MRSAPILILILTTLSQGQGVESAIERAARDVRTLPADVALRARYFWRPRQSLNDEKNLKLLGDKKRFLKTHANFLSSEAEIADLVQVAPDLWRIDIADCGWKAEVWERLAEVEPWFHEPILAAEVDVEVEENVEIGWWILKGTTDTYVTAAFKKANPDKVYWKLSHIDKRKKKVKRPVKAKFVRAPAYGNPTLYAELIKRTQSQVPIVRADWFLHQTAIAQDRVAGYYDWHNIGKKRADFDAHVGADLKVSQKLRRAPRAIIGRSTVTRNNRGMEGGATLTDGIRMLTDDYDRSQDDKNPLRLLQNDAKRAGGEGLGNLPNGLIFMWVEDAQGNRLDAVPSAIASDSASRGPDRDVHAGLCMRCHQEGYRPIADWARRIYQPPFSLDSPDYKLQKELRSAYLSDLNRFLARGRTTYADALQRCGGYTPQTWSKALADEWSAYADEDRSLADVAREFGISADEFEKKLRAEADRKRRAGLKLDPVLVGLLEGLSVRIEWIEELVPEIIRISRSKS